MNSRERVLAAIEHREPDRIPFDLGGMAQSGMHAIGYRNLREHLGLPAKKARIQNINTQQACFDEDIQEKLSTDAVMINSDWASVEKSQVYDQGEYWGYLDDWGVKRRMPKNGGLYFDVCSHPLAGDGVLEKFKQYPWPDPVRDKRFGEFRGEARRARARGKFTVLMGLCPGIVEMYAWMRGFEDFYMDLASQPKVAEMFLDKLAALKIAYWERALAELDGLVDAINEADDMAGQTNLLFSPATYRNIVKPYHRKLFQAIKRAAPQVKIIFHSCGSVRKLIPDLIENGVDILNPLQVSATGMDPLELKREFGRDICFWGGGVDAQNVLTQGPAESIRENVLYNLNALAPGGGFIFAPTHIIQPLVTPENVLVMWNTLQEYNLKAPAP